MAKVYRVIATWILLGVAAKLEVAGETNDILERERAVFLLAYGRSPAPSELAPRSSTDHASVTALFKFYTDRIRGDREAALSVRTNAYRDVYGGAPSGSAVERVENPSVTYAENARVFLAALNQDHREYEGVLQRAYQATLGRDPYPGELRYWKAQPYLSYVMLTACIDNWARRNAPGLMETAGVASLSVNSEYVLAQRVSGTVALELRELFGLPAEPRSDLARAMNRTVVAPGAGTIVSVGGVHFVATGRR